MLYLSLWQQGENIGAVLGTLALGVGLRQEREKNDAIYIAQPQSLIV